MLKPYTIRYVSGKTLQPCVDTQLAHNIIAAHVEHKKFHPDSRSVEIRRQSDSGWLKFY
jgi:hypothetical protein